MKIHLLLEIITAFLFILSPIIVHSSGQIILKPFSILFFAVYGFLSIVMLIRVKNIKTEICRTDTFYKTNEMEPQKRWIFTITVFIILNINAFLWNLVAKTAGFSQQLIFDFQENLFLYFNIFLGTIVSAFYEEILYRFYAPTLAFLMIESIKEKSKNRTKEKLKIVFESIIIILFALGHKNGGWPSVMNALFAGTILRIFAVLFRQIKHSLRKAIRNECFICRNNTANICNKDTKNRKHCCCTRHF